jgi:hypothetical protein
MRFDRSRPESPETQALIQQRAAAKRARRAQAYRRAAELSAMGVALSRAGVDLREATRRSGRAWHETVVGTGSHESYRSLSAEASRLFAVVRAGIYAIAARRRQP